MPPIKDNSFIKITPTCRYEHGPLTNLSTIANSDFAFVAVDKEQRVADVRQFFAGNLFVCLRCGYVEVFDSDLAATVDHLKS